MQWPSPIARIVSVVLLSLGTYSVSALSLVDLRNAPNLTPTTFASYFRDFSFNFRKDIQRPNVFLMTKAGDCDDYSTLAAAVLRERGYTPRLISVRMPGVTHVVCYIEETHSYLDYNFRGYTVAIRPTTNPLESIAENVAQSYGLNWTSVSEFTYSAGVKRLVQTVPQPRKTTETFAGLFR